MKIEILGTGCAKCNMLEAVAKSAAEKLGVPFAIEHIRDINEIVRRGVMLTPALAVNGEVKVAGRVPSEADLARMLAAVADAAK